METADGLFERTDEIEVPRSRVENSLFAACTLIAYNAFVKEKQPITIKGWMQQKNLC